MSRVTTVNPWSRAVAIGEHNSHFLEPCLEDESLGGVAWPQTLDATSDFAKGQDAHVHVLRTEIGRVVDDRGRVLRIDGLVVADASVMPTIPRANTNLTTVAIAERLAETI